MVQFKFLRPKHHLYRIPPLTVLDPRAGTSAGVKAWDPPVDCCSSDIYTDFNCSSAKFEWPLRGNFTGITERCDGMLGKPLNSESNASGATGSQTGCHHDLSRVHTLLTTAYPINSCEILMDIFIFLEQN